MSTKLTCAAALAAALAWSGSAPAHADRLTEAPELQPKLSLKHRIKTNITRLSSELGRHVSALSFDLIGMRFDAHTNKAKVKVDAGGEDLSFCLDSKLHFRRGVARVRARIGLALAGRQISFELPEFDVVPRSYGGRQYVELRVPLLEGSF